MAGLKAFLYAEGLMDNFPDPERAASPRRIRRTRRARQLEELEDDDEEKEEKEVQEVQEGEEGEQEQPRRTGRKRVRVEPLTMSLRSLTPESPERSVSPEVLRIPRRKRLKRVETLLSDSSLSKILDKNALKTKSSRKAHPVVRSRILTRHRTCLTAVEADELLLTVLGGLRDLARLVRSYERTFMGVPDMKCDKNVTAHLVLPDGGIVLSGTREIGVWDPAKQKLRWCVEKHEHFCGHVEIAGGLVAVLQGSEVFFYEPKTGALVNAFTDGVVCRMGAHAGGNAVGLVLEEPERFEIRDLATGVTEHISTTVLSSCCLRVQDVQFLLPDLIMVSTPHHGMTVVRANGDATWTETPVQDEAGSINPKAIAMAADGVTVLALDFSGQNLTMRTIDANMVWTSKRRVRSVKLPSLLEPGKTKKHRPIWQLARDATALVCTPQNVAIVVGQAQVWVVDVGTREILSHYAWQGLSKDWFTLKVAVIWPMAVTVNHSFQLSLIDLLTGEEETKSKCEDNAGGVVMALKDGRILAGQRIWR